MKVLEKNFYFERRGFNYKNNPINENDDFFNKMFPIESEIQDYDKSLIDPSFVTDDGDPILNTIIKKYDELFGNNYNIKYEENFKIYFRFLKNVLKGKNGNYDPNETYSTLREIKDIDINRHYNGIITKYFPLVELISV